MLNNLIGHNWMDQIIPFFKHKNNNKVVPFREHFKYTVYSCKQSCQNSYPPVTVQFNLKSNLPYGSHNWNLQLSFSHMINDNILKCGIISYFGGFSPQHFSLFLFTSFILPFLLLKRFQELWTVLHNIKCSIRECLALYSPHQTRVEIFFYIFPK